MQRRGRLVEQLIAANPAIEQAADLGVDVRLGVTAWGLYVGGPALRALPSPMVGLADEDRSWMCGFDKLILATGARDVALGFPGWDQPGVVGANGLAALIERYDAFTGQRIVVLGSGELGVAAALMAQARGLEVAAVVEVLRRAQASTVSLTRLHADRHAHPDRPHAQTRRGRPRRRRAPGSERRPGPRGRPRLRHRLPGARR